MILECRVRVSAGDWVRITRQACFTFPELYRPCLPISSLAPEGTADRPGQPIYVHRREPNGQQPGLAAKIPVLSRLAVAAWYTE